LKSGNGVADFQAKIQELEARSYAQKQRTAASSLNFELDTSNFQGK
jgi:hypothetical protein